MAGTSGDLCSLPVHTHPSASTRQSESVGPSLIGSSLKSLGIHINWNFSKPQNKPKITACRPWVNIPGSSHGHSPGKAEKPSFHTGALGNAGVLSEPSVTVPPFPPWQRSAPWTTPS